MPIPIREDGAPWRNFYGRRRGKTLRKGQVQHLDTTLTELCVPGIDWEGNPDRTPLDLKALFGWEQPMWLEIGFGGGEHLLHMAQTYPEIPMIGCEPFVNGVATLVPRLSELSIGNVRLHPGDARDLLDVLPDESVGRAFLLYPDPWPKKRHHRRRFVSADNLDTISRVLTPGAVLRVVTDIPDYVRHTMELMMARPDFDWLAEAPRDWRQPWEDWTCTRYEAKALREGRKGHYLTFRKV